MAAEAGSPWSPAHARARDRADARAGKRDAVLRTAARLFNEKGFHATSLDEVAEQLHVTKPTLYYYVENKEQILFDCVRAGLDLVRAGIADASARGGSTLDQLRACMHAYVQVVTQEFGMCVIRVGEDALPAPRRRELRQLKAQIDAEFRALIQLGIDQGAIAPCSAKLAAFMLAGALSWIGRWYREGGEWSPAEVSRQCTAMLLDGIAARPTMSAMSAMPAESAGTEASAVHPVTADTGVSSAATLPAVTPVSATAPAIAEDSHPALTTAAVSGARPANTGVRPASAAPRRRQKPKQTEPAP